MHQLYEKRGFRIDPLKPAYRLMAHGTPPGCPCPVLHDLAEWAAGPAPVGAFGRGIAELFFSMLGRMDTNGTWVSLRLNIYE